MKTTLLRTLVCIAGLWGTSTGCMTTSTGASSEVENQIPPVDDVGLEDGRTNYSWMKYKGTIPFASETSRSTAITGGKGGAPVFASTARKAKPRRVAKAP